MMFKPKQSTPYRFITTSAVLCVILTWAAAHPALAESPPLDPFVASSAIVRPSVVAIGSYHFKDKPTVQYFGTGFVIQDGLTVATNAHVIDSVRKKERLEHLRVFLPDGGVVQGRAATVWAEDGVHDVALLKIEGAPVAAVDLDDDAPVIAGQSVGVLGYPIGLRLGLVPAVHRGVIAAVVPAVLPLPRGARMNPDLADALKHPYDLYQLDLTVYPGNSGSPLYDARDGRVIGIINKTLATGTREHLLDKPSGISYAVPARWIKELIIRGSLSSEQQ